MVNHIVLGIFVGISKRWAPGFFWVIAAQVFMAKCWWTTRTIGQFSYWQVNGHLFMAHKTSMFNSQCFHWTASSLDEHHIKPPRRPLEPLEPLRSEARWTRPARSPGSQRGWPGWSWPRDPFMAELIQGDMVISWGGSMAMGIPLKYLKMVGFEGEIPSINGWFTHETWGFSHDKWWFHHRQIGF